MSISTGNNSYKVSWSLMNLNPYSKENFIISLPAYISTDPIHKINFELNLNGIIRLLFVVSFFIIIISGFLWMYYIKDQEKEEYVNDKFNNHQCIHKKKDSNENNSMSDSGISYQMDKH